MSKYAMSFVGVPHPDPDCGLRVSFRTLEQHPLEWQEAHRREGATGLTLGQRCYDHQRLRNDVATPDVDQ